MKPAGTVVPGEYVFTLAKGTDPKVLEATLVDLNPRRIQPLGGDTVLVTFGEDPGLVARMVAAQVRGTREGGMLATAKHFPGHGFVAADSHVDIPVDRRALKAILADDAAPYGWLGSVLTAVILSFGLAPFRAFV